MKPHWKSDRLSNSAESAEQHKIHSLWVLKQTEVRHFFFAWACSFLSSVLGLRLKIEGFVVSMFIQLEMICLSADQHLLACYSLHLVYDH